MALSTCSVRVGTISIPSTRQRWSCLPTVGKSHSQKPPSFRVLADFSPPKARFVAKRTESTSVKQLQRPLVEYMSLPASQYSVLDAERIERVDENTFRCYVYRLKFFSFEVCPVLLVRVEEQPNGCCIRLLSCKLEGSPIVAAQNDKFSASMVNRVSCNVDLGNSSVQELATNTTIEVIIDIPFAFQAIPVQAIESTGTQVLEQLLKIMLPRFLAQQKNIHQKNMYVTGANTRIAETIYRTSGRKPLVKDYKAWASGDTSRQPLGTGQI